MIYAFFAALAFAALCLIGMINAANSTGPGDIRAGNAIVCFMGLCISGFVAFILLIIAAFT